MSIKELQRRYESGGKQVKTVRVQIKEQLKRECAARGCHNSLAFERADRVLCGDHPRLTVKEAQQHNVNKRPVVKKTKAELRKENREKKRRYYERHGITFKKTVRNRQAVPGKLALSKGTAQEYTDQPLIYENYKEPLKPIPKAEGYGYYGTVATTADKELVQCHICGNLFSSLSGHIRKHNMTTREYKERYQLSLSSALISETRRTVLQEQVAKRRTSSIQGLPEWLKEYNAKGQPKAARGEGSRGKGKGWSLEKRNELGICPAQVLDKIKEAATALGHTPSSDEFERYYGGKFRSSIRYHYGTYTEAVRKAKLIPASDTWSPDNETLLQDLRDFYEKNGRVPTTSDFKRGLLTYPRQMYFRHFGSLNNARIEAGLNALLPLPFGKQVELTPDEYARYKAGLPVEAIKRPRSASKRRARRREVIEVYE